MSAVNKLQRSYLLVTINPLAFAEPNWDRLMRGQASKGLSIFHSMLALIDCY